MSHVGKNRKIDQIEVSTSSKIKDEIDPILRFYGNQYMPLNKKIMDWILITKVLFLVPPLYLGLLGRFLCKSCTLCMLLVFLLDYMQEIFLNKSLKDAFPHFEHFVVTGFYFYAIIIAHLSGGGVSLLISQSSMKLEIGSVVGAVDTAALWGTFRFPLITHT